MSVPDTHSSFSPVLALSTVSENNAPRLEAFLHLHLVCSGYSQAPELWLAPRHRCAKRKDIDQ